MPTIMEQMQLGWGNPDNPDYASDHLTTFTAAGVTMHVREETKRIFHALILLMDRRYHLDKGQLDDWSYANRDIQGYPGLKSYHAWGLAIDLNALQNVMGSHEFQFDRRYTAHIANACSLTWGGLWTDRPDAMHFEYRGSRASLRSARRRLRLRHPLVWRKTR